MSEPKPKYPISRVNDSRWIKVTPTEANPDMEKPPKLERGGEVFDTNSPHLVAPPGPSSPNLCHVYLCGTGCNPTQKNPASNWLSTTADAGIASIALSYQWGPYSDMERNQMFHGLAIGDGSGEVGVQTSLENYHADILFGGSKSKVVKVSFCNSIMGRLVSLFQYLQQTRPESEGWDRFLSYSTETTPSQSVATGGNSPKKRTGFVVPKFSLCYERLIFSGHSQGAGHVAFLAKHVQLARAVLVSGPQETVPQPSPAIGQAPGPKITHRRGASEVSVSAVENPSNKTAPAGSTAAASALNADGGNYDEVAVAEAVVLKKSWLDGPYATEDIRAFMHDEEEHSAHLIRQNWARIAPLAEAKGAQYTDILFAEHRKLVQAGADSGGVVVGLMSCLVSIVPIMNLWYLPYSEPTQEFPDRIHYVWSAFSDPFGNSFRTFYTTIGPENVRDHCGGRPNHLSTISDRNTPLDIYEDDPSSREENCFFPLSEDGKEKIEERQLVPKSRFKAVPVYKKSIWKHLLLDDVKPFGEETEKIRDGMLHSEADGDGNTDVLSGAVDASDAASVAFSDGSSAVKSRL